MGRHRLAPAPHSVLEGRFYWLELSSGPGFPQVPGLPGFPSDPYAISDASAAHQCGTGHALAVRPPDRSLTDFHPLPGHRGIASSKPCPCRPTPEAPPRIGSKGEFRLPAPVVAERALLEALGFSELPALGGAGMSHPTQYKSCGGGWPPPRTWRFGGLPYSNNWQRHCTLKSVNARNIF